MAVRGKTESVRVTDVCEPVLTAKSRLRSAKASTPQRPPYRRTQRPSQFIGLIEAPLQVSPRMQWHWHHCVCGRQDVVASVTK